MQREMTNDTPTGAWEGTWGIFRSTLQLFSSCITSQFLSTVLPCSTEEPAADVIYNQFQVPLPKVATRDVVAIKYWVSDYMTEDGTEGTAASVVASLVYPPTLSSLGLFLYG